VKLPTFRGQFQTGTGLPLVSWAGRTYDL